MRRRRSVPLPGLPAVDGQIIGPSPQRRRWPTSTEREFGRRLAQQQRAERAAHLAKYGPHTCTPDPTDPWSVCHLESTKEETR